MAESHNLVAILKLTVLFLSLPTFIFSAPEIQFSFGRIQGFDKLSYITKKPYSVYYGIPFAQPPVGNLRFQPPQPFVGSDPATVISSDKYRAACMQGGYSGFMDEDCLYLNVFVPQGGASVKKAMVWIHGGGFVVGDAKTYEPTRMITEYDVIVVTIHYRLAAFGFATTQDSAMPGNNGLRDQILAIQWVKDNIRQFGGDPTDIAIFGESAGAGSVSLLSISPLTKGLFTKGIMQSGTALSPFSNIKKPLDITYKLATTLGCLPWLYFPMLKQGYHQNMADCLQRKSAAEINQPPSWQDNQVNLDIGTLIDFGPVTDGEVIPKGPKILADDKAYLEKIGALDRSYIIGANNNEGISTMDYLVFAAGGTLDDVRKPETASVFVRSISESVVSILTPPMLDLIDFVYTFPRGQDNLSNIQGLLDITTDTNFVVPAVQFARALTKASDKTSVYLYLFDHYPQLKDPNGPLKGSNHGHDVLFQFDLTSDLLADDMTNYIVVGTPTNSPVFEVFTGALTSFAKTGNPSRTGSEFSSLTWPSFDPQDEYYMAISATPEARKHMYSRRVSLWTDFLPRMTSTFYSGGRGRVSF